MTSTVVLLNFARRLVAARNDFRAAAGADRYETAVEPYRQRLREQMHAAHNLVEAFKCAAVAMPDDQWPLLAAALVDELERGLLERN